MTEQPPRYLIPVTASGTLPKEHGFIVHEANGTVIGFLPGQVEDTDLSAVVGPHVILTWCPVHGNTFRAWTKHMPRPWEA